MEKYKANDYCADEYAEMVLRDMVADGFIDAEYTLDALLRWMSREQKEEFFENFMRDLDVKIVYTDEELEEAGE